MAGRGGGGAIGIDLGTTFSCVAAWLNGQVVVFTNDQGNRLTPSYVSFNENERLVGDGAKNEAASNAANTIFDAKRLIGKRFSDQSVQSDAKLWPFMVIEGSNDKPTIMVQYKGEERLLVAEEISAMVLAKMKETAEEALGGAVSKAVVTVPAYFNDSQRQATKDAATIAGLDVLMIINEPTAGAIAYGLQNTTTGRSGARKALIFDLGGGTLDVSVVMVDPSGAIAVKATDGNTHLGGEDFDNRMVSHFAELFRRMNGVDITGNPRSMRRLRTECEKVKRMLSTACHATMNLDSLYDNIDFKAPITRARFEDLNRDLFEQCLETTRRCLEAARVDRSSIDDVVLVGGSTRIPMIRAMLMDFFNVENLCMSVNADEAVAIGAAIQAASLNGEPVGCILLNDVTPLSLGLNIRGGLTHVVIPRNTPVPCRREQTYTTSEDNMTQMRFRVYEGERAESELNNLLGEFYVNGIRKARKGAVRFRVVFSVDANGILTVSAEDVEKGRKIEVTITNESGRLSREVMERMVGDARRFEIEDEEKRRAARAKNQLEEYVVEVASKLKISAVKSKLGWAERRTLEGKIKDLKDWTSGCVSAPLYVVEDKMNELRRIWEPVKLRLRRDGVNLN